MILSTSIVRAGETHLNPLLVLVTIKPLLKIFFNLWPNPY